MSRSRKVTKHPRFRDIDAWEALKRRELDYAINLLVSGEWIIDSVVKDGWSSLDVRVSSERCHETALLALTLRRLVLDYLRDSNLHEEFKTLTVEYRTGHAEVFKLEDVYIENSARYNSVLELIVDFMGPDWTIFIASARTLASFSVLSTMERGLNIYYRRLGDVVVATSKEQRAAGMGEYYDTEFRPKAFDTKPRVCKTLPEQIREVFHFPKAKKINPRQKEHPIVIGSFSSSMQILITLCCLYNIPATLCMPRLRISSNK
ncbi:hypothetical protein LZL87_003665 [Fusarium oxysporum]|nr:hypothetical protein LZL87_003665 [Fusarium oxysporum]